MGSGVPEQFHVGGRTPLAATANEKDSTRRQQANHLCGHGPGVGDMLEDVQANHRPEARGGPLGVL